MTKKKPKFYQKSGKIYSFEELTNGRYVYNNHGISRGFYKGLLISVCLNFLYRGWAIGCFDTFKTVKHEYSAIGQISIFTFFVFFSSFILHPFDTTRRTYMNDSNFSESKV
jgi:hypothetical protein